MNIRNAKFTGSKYYNTRLNSIESGIFSGFRTPGDVDFTKAARRERNKEVDRLQPAWENAHVTGY